MSTTEILLQQAREDLAFALAQADGYAEDEAAERIRTLTEQLEHEDAAEAGAA